MKSEQHTLELVSLLSHDLLAAARHVALYADALKEDAQDPDAVHTYAARLENKSVELTDLIFTATALARAEGYSQCKEPIPALALLADLGLASHVECAVAEKSFSVLANKALLSLSISTFANYTRLAGEGSETVEIKLTPSDANVVYLLSTKPRLVSDRPLRSLEGPHKTVLLGLSQALERVSSKLGGTFDCDTRGFAKMEFQLPIC